MSKRLTIYNPYDQSEIKTIDLHSKTDVENALVTAHKLHSDSNKRQEKYQIKSVLERFKLLMIKNRDLIIKTSCLEGGKPLLDTEIEMIRAIDGVQIALNHISSIKGKEIPMGLNAASMNRTAYTIKEAIGPVVSISAFNHPINLIIHQTITAIAVGAPVIIKPALTTPLTAMLIVDLIHKAGLAREYCQLIVCNNEDAEILACDSRVKYLSFIGSAKVGWYLRSKIAPGTYIALEHGGAAPVIVEEDADIEDMLPLLTKGAFYHAGQVCVSVQRVFVHENILEKVKNGLIQLANKLVIGNPINNTTEIGPLILPRELDRIEKWVNEAIEGGAQLLCGGKRISESLFEATILFNAPMDANVSRKEIFGPVMCIYSFSDREKAITLANAVPFAFQAAVFTKNIDLAYQIARQLNASAVMINDHTAFRVDWMPFGGKDQSGIGIGGIPYTMEDMTTEKLMIIRYKDS
jgi:acyl-CoA reductase-like NAD-dependent aldehyde dehydrogenase